MALDRGRSRLRLVYLMGSGNDGHKIKISFRHSGPQQLSAPRVCLCVAGIDWLIKECCFFGSPSPRLRKKERKETNEGATTQCLAVGLIFLPPFSALKTLRLWKREQRGHQITLSVSGSHSDIVWALGIAKIRLSSFHDRCSEGGRGMNGVVSKIWPCQHQSVAEREVQKASCSISVSELWEREKFTLNFSSVDWMGGDNTSKCRIVKDQEKGTFLSAFPRSWLKLHRQNNKRYLTFQSHLLKWSLEPPSKLNSHGLSFWQKSVFSNGPFFIPWVEFLRFFLIGISVHFSFSPRHSLDLPSSFIPSRILFTHWGMHE